MLSQNLSTNTYHITCFIRNEIGFAPVKRTQVSDFAPCYSSPLSTYSHLLLCFPTNHFQANLFHNTLSTPLF